MIPGYVENYWAAQWWQFLYIGLPAIVIAGIAAFIVALQEYREAMHVNDEPRKGDMPPGKTLGL